jgi:hypothetical protein
VQTAVGVATQTYHGTQEDQTAKGIAAICCDGINHQD